MKNKVLLITYEFSPSSNGTLACLENIMPLLSHSCDVDIITRKFNLSDKSQENMFGAKVIRVARFFDKILLYKIALLKHLKNHKRLSFLIKVAFHPFMLIEQKVGIDNLSNWQKNMKKIIIKKLDINNYDTILAVGAPFENIKVANEIKLQFNKKFGIIQFDLYTTNPVMTQYETNEHCYANRLKEEKNWYQNADFIIVTLEAYETIMKSELNEFKSKINPLGTPNLLNLGNNQDSINVLHSDDDKAINVLYCGMFYPSLRSPKFMLEVFVLICKAHPEVRLHIIGFGCENIIAQYKPILGNNLILYGQKSREFALNAVREADILLNVSNKSTDQAPSKILEYIGTGKPILNFYTVDNDICVKYLRNYPLSFSTFEFLDDIIYSTSQLIYDFCVNNKGRSLNFSDIEKNYSQFMPKFYADKLITLIGCVNN